MHVHCTSGDYDDKKVMFKQCIVLGKFSICICENL